MLLRFLINPSQIRLGNNQVVASYNKGGTAFPKKKLTILHVPSVVFTDDTGNELGSSISWELDTIMGSDFSKTLHIKAKSGLPNNFKIELEMEVTSSAGNVDSNSQEISFTTP